MTPPSRSSERLGFRLAFLLAVALLPLGVISALQAQALLDETRARSEAAILGATRLAASEEVRAIQRAQGAAEALAEVVPYVLDDPDLCMRVFVELIEKSDVYSFAAFYDGTGHASCTSLGRPLDFGVSETLREAIKDPMPVVSINRDAQFSKTSVLFARHPVFTDGGTLLGFASISVPHASLMPESVKGGDALPLMLLTFNGAGDVITSSVGLDGYERLLPKDRALAAFAGGSALAFTALANDGREHSFSVVPLVPDTLYALGSWPVDALPGAWSLSALPPVAVPALMWLVSLGVALIAAERLVTRHIKALTRAITGFARGDRLTGPLGFADAPVEIRAAGDAFDTMTASILRDEAELENALHQKEVLLREVHHRVKNNLQLIASIMNMQARRAHTPEAKILVRRLQDRVMSLATIHRGLYQTSGLADVRADELLQDILRQIVNLAEGPGHRFDVTSDLAPLRLTPDQAVPLALLVTEALTNAMKYARGANGRGRLEVTLTERDDGVAELVVANSIVPDGPAPTETAEGESTGLGTHLVKAFVAQLDGREERVVTDTEYRLSVQFAIRPLAGAEDRETAAEPDAAE